MVAPGRYTYVLFKKVDQISGSLNRHFEKGILCVLHIIMYKLRFKLFGDYIKWYLL